MLRDHLPSKEEHVILVRLSPVQRALYTEFMKRFREAGNSGWLGLNPLKAFCVCCKVRHFFLGGGGVHPETSVSGAICLHLGALFDVMQL